MGFSIFIWDIRNKISNETNLVNIWGGFSLGRFYPDRVMGPRDYLLEGRIFYAHLPMLAVKIGSEEELLELARKLNQSWSPILDKMKKMAEVIMNEGHGGVHVDKIFTDELLKEINDTYPDNIKVEPC